jgi:hypothetical protein
MARLVPLPDTAGVSDPDPRRLIRAGTLDAELAALLWLLLEGGAPLVVTGLAATSHRAEVASSLLSLVPGRAWTVIDADVDPPTTEGLAALLRGGAGFALLQSAVDLKSWLAAATDMGLPEDGVRRLGIVVVLAHTDAGLRCEAVHYLRPSERDAQGHVQRRPPAVLATWDPESDAFDHYAWGITPELADRADRAQADLEERQRDRTAFLARDGAGDAYVLAATGYLATEPPREPAPQHPAARPSPFSGGLTDPDPDPHLH